MSSRGAPLRRPLDLQVLLQVALQRPHGRVQGGQVLPPLLDAGLDVLLAQVPPEGRHIELPVKVKLAGLAGLGHDRAEGGDVVLGPLARQGSSPELPAKHVLHQEDVLEAAGGLRRHVDEVHDPALAHPRGRDLTAVARALREQLVWRLRLHELLNVLQASAEALLHEGGPQLRRRGVVEVFEELQDFLRRGRRGHAASL